MSNTVKTAAEMLERMEALVRRMAAAVADKTSNDRVLIMPDYLEAAAIVAKMTPPVDPDLVEARKLGSQFAPARPEWDCMLEGKHDSSPAVIALLAAIKRGRELERGQ